MDKGTNSLLFKFGIIFAIFTIITLVVSGISTYINQNSLYQDSCETNVQQLATHLEEQIIRSGDEFNAYQSIMISHADEIDIPCDFDNYMPAKNEFYDLFEKKYPGKVPGKDVGYLDMPLKLQLAFAKYQHEYWMLLFEEVRESFSTSYTYYVVPTGQKWHMYYMIECVREAREDDPDNLNLCIDVLQDPDVYPRMWQAMTTGEKPDGNDTIKNSFGKTYAYFNPLNINRQTMGVIAVELDIADVNSTILLNTASQMVKITLILAVSMLILLYFINRLYISKLSRLKVQVGDYSTFKDPQIARSIEDVAGTNRDEISSLAQQVAAMILELDKYMKNLVKTTNELEDTKQKAATMNELALKDALTGVRNKAAYDNEIRKLNWRIEDGFKEFAIGMVDLNFLKRINDTYGHERGNEAIRAICRLICVTFKHSAVFRIGGDEFVIILTGEDYENKDSLVKDFNEALGRLAADDTLEPWEAVSAAMGIAVFDETIDSDAANVFKRADKIMFANKKEMKAVREN